MLFVCITRLASKEIFLPSNKIHREVGRAKDLSTPLYTHQNTPVHRPEHCIVSFRRLLNFQLRANQIDFNAAI